jgi:hypothetical protein
VRLTIRRRRKQCERFRVVFHHIDELLKPAIRSLPDWADLFLHLLHVLDHSVQHQLQFDYQAAAKPGAYLQLLIRLPIRLKTQHSVKLKVRHLLLTFQHLRHSDCLDSLRLPR